LALGAGLALLLALWRDPAFFVGNWNSGLAFFASRHFLFFSLAAAMLAWPRVANRWYEVTLFSLATLYLYLFYGDYLLLMHMSGDSICQVAYWNILFRPELTGALGVAFGKPGQIILLGLLYQFSLLAGHWLFKVGLCLIMAACVWSLAAVATDLGGRVAGVLAFFLSLWAFQADFVFSGSAIYAITAVFAGLRLYFASPDSAGSPRWRWLGRLLLVLAIQFRIEAIAVLAVVGLIHWARREWRQMWLFALWTALSLLFFVGLLYMVQGSLDRLNSGAAVGYVGPVLANGQMDPALSEDKIQYIIRMVKEDFSNQVYIRFLFILVIAGISGLVFFPRRYYLSVFASLTVIVANVFLLGGTFNLERYCDLIYAFGCAIGSGVLVCYATWALRRRTFMGAVGVAFAILVLLAGFDFARLNVYQQLDPAGTSEAFASTMDLLEDDLLPERSRLMTEDDLLAHMLVIAPDRFPAVTSLQYFNVASLARRQEILARTDFIWIDLNGFPYYYLFHMARQEWLSDPFRQMVQAMLAGQGGEERLYGVRFVPVDISPSRLLLRVEH
jgi:hypothetical protein